MALLNREQPEATISLSFADLPGNSATAFTVEDLNNDGKALGVKRAGWGWHSDGEDKKFPNMGSMLYGVKTPKVGGDTGFAAPRETGR